MMCELSVIFRGGGIGSFDRVGYFEMKPLAPGRRQAAEHSLSSQLVGELEPGPGTVRDRVNQFSFFGFLDALQNRIGIGSRSKPEGFQD